MHQPFIYKNNELVINSYKETPLSELMSKYEKPIYIYNLKDIELRYNHLVKVFDNNIDIHYALKANNNKEVVQKLISLGSGVDAVSLGEVNRALGYGVSSDKIILSGVAKTIREIKSSIEQKIFQFNVESPEELLRISEISKQMNTKVNVAFRLNPDVNAQTHPYIRTGFRDNKFGMDFGFIPKLVEILRSNELLNLTGLSVHIGSQLKEIDSIFDAVNKVSLIYRELQGMGFPMGHFDIGGGVGISYEGRYQEDFDLLTKYGREVMKILKPLNCKIHCEPGRYLVGPSGILVTEVQYIKKTDYKNFAIVDTGMHHLMRPCLYQAHHRILPVSDTKSPEILYDVVGPICESSDTLGKSRLLSGLKQGDKLAIFDAGAYGYVMANSYNDHPLPDEYSF